MTCAGCEENKHDRCIGGQMNDERTGPIECACKGKEHDHKKPRPIRFDDRGNVWADGARYDDTKKALLKAAKIWRDCARSVVQSAQTDTDETYRLMGAGAAWHRLNVSKALLERAMSKGR